MLWCNGRSYRPKWTMQNRGFVPVQQSLLSEKAGWHSVYKKRKWWKVLLLLAGVSICFNEMKNIEKAEKVSIGVLLRTEAMEQLTPTLFPVFSFVNSEGHENSLRKLMEQRVAGAVPLYAYGQRDAFMVKAESRLSYDEIIRQEGSDEMHDDIPESIVPEGEMETALEEENSQARKDEAAKENQRYLEEFIPRKEKLQTYSRDSMQDEEWVRKQFYVIDATTQAQPGQLAGDKFLEMDMRVEKGGEVPKILIYHTHSQETYIDSAPGDPSQSVVGVGERLTELLRDEYGYNVLHHTGEYDVERRDYAYSKAAPALEALLQQYPDIEVVIDLHRDSVAADRKLAVDLDGRPTAMVMFFNGLSYTNHIGPIDYLKNDNLSGNLAFAFKMQLACNEYYPGLTRKIYLKGYRYNMHYRPKTLLIELGAQTNTVEEAMNACDPLAHALSLVFEGEY